VSLGLRSLLGETLNDELTKAVQSGRWMAFVVYVDQSNTVQIFRKSHNYPRELPGGRHPIGEAKGLIDKQFTQMYSELIRSPQGFPFSLPGLPSGTPPESGQD